jgi:hypothetical protein
MRTGHELCRATAGKAGPRLPEGKLMLRAIVIASAIGLAAPSYAQVKVITGDVEHVYGPGGEILDSPELRALAAPSSPQVKVITGDVEHVYGPGGEILDSPELRAKNQREMRGEERPATLPEQQSLSVQQSGPSRAPNSWWRYQPPTSWWNNNGYTPPKSAWSQ